MIIKILLLLISFLVVTNLVLIIISAVFNVNLYKKYGRIIAVFYCAFFFFIAAVYLIFAMLGLF